MAQRRLVPNGQEIPYGYRVIGKMVMHGWTYYETERTHEDILKIPITKSIPEGYEKIGECKIPSMSYNVVGKPCK